MTDRNNALESPSIPVHTDELLHLLSSKVVGQTQALENIVPSIQVYLSGLAPEDRPAGVFLLLGPTGTGKTRTVEALAEVLHGDAKKILKIDCGEFQSDHEVAKLIGAPPGYVGHADSEPILSVHALAEVTTPDCGLAIVLFDEIEKAAPTLSQLLLGLLDKATLRLGDGSQVNFEESLIFFTSNLGAREMMGEITPGIGFGSAPRKANDLAKHLERIGTRAVEKHFSPEFVNRLDAVMTYRPLDPGARVAILDQHIVGLQQHVHNRLGERSFDIAVTPAARYFMLDKGTSAEYGARELRRVIHRHLTQPLATLVANREADPGATVEVDLAEDGDALVLHATGGVPIERRELKMVMAVDDNEPLLDWMERVVTNADLEFVRAATVKEAATLIASAAPDVLILDYCLPDGDGVTLAVEVLRDFPLVRPIIMTGGVLDEEEALIRHRHGIPLLVKPFLSEELMGAIKAAALHDPAHKAVGG
jgi:CheY-like chemotaxis protein/energy-coupling factor transporter ATP-binding protein EcfA2